MNRARKFLQDKIDVDKIKKFLIDHKTAVIASIVVTLLAWATFLVSFAFFTSSYESTIVGGKVGKIPDLEVKIMVQNRDASGNAIDGYSAYSYIPKAGYAYNSGKSYCSKGSTISYNNYEATISKVTQKDVCYLYFDSTAVLDITLNVFVENVDANGVGTGIYTQLKTNALPSVGYTFNSDMSGCNNGSTMSYNDLENLLTVESSQKDVCDAYMDALDVDISLNVYLQAKAGSSEYYEAKTIPDNVFYTLNSSKSSCTNGSTMSVQSQRVVIAAAKKTSCEAYLDVSSGPIIEEVTSSVNGNKVTMNFTSSLLGTPATAWYWVVDNGDYAHTYGSSATITLPPYSPYTISIFSVDAAGNTSAIKKITGETTYSYSGFFDYSSSVQTKEIEVSGYYKLEVWGAQGGSYSGYAGGMGGYSVGIAYLNKGDKLFVHTGGQPTTYNTSATNGNTNAGGVNGGGAGRTFSYSGTTTYGMGGGGGTDIRIKPIGNSSSDDSTFDTYYARVIVAGGGSGSTNGSNGYAGGGTSGVGYSSAYYGTQTGAGTGGSFGQGGAASGSYNYKYGSSGGGGGWYGGGAGTTVSDTSTTYRQYNGGGSGYVYTSATADSYPAGCLLNSSYYLKSASTTPGTDNFSSPTGAIEEGHSGNGYAKVTYLGQSI